MSKIVKSAGVSQSLKWLLQIAPVVQLTFQNPRLINKNSLRIKKKKKKKVDQGEMTGLCNK